MNHYISMKIEMKMYFDHTKINVIWLIYTGDKNIYHDLFSNKLLVITNN